MEGIGVAFIAILALAVVAVSLARQRKRAAAVDLEDTSWLRPQVVEEPTVAHHARVISFHVKGTEAEVTFDVPLPAEDDPLLADLLVDEAVEVVREKRHTLPIDEVTEIVVLAGRGEVRQVARTMLPSPGELPPPIQAEMLNLTHIARDPFASQFDPDRIYEVDTRVSVPTDDLAPLVDELKLPAGLSRGLRTRGVDPDRMSAPVLVVTILEMFGYEVTPQGDGDTYVAVKDNQRTFIRVVSHAPGEYPELDEQMVRKFMAEFATSGAARGLLVTDKIGPFMIHDVEANERRVRFITRERMQTFIDSMALA